MDADLLSSICKFKKNKLKKQTTIDKSAPLVAGSSSSRPTPSHTNHGPNSNPGTSSSHFSPPVGDFMSEMANKLKKKGMKSSGPPPPAPGPGRSSGPPVSSRGKVGMSIKKNAPSDDIPPPPSFQPPNPTNFRAKSNPTSHRPHHDVPPPPPDSPPLPPSQPFMNPNKARQPSPKFRVPDPSPKFNPPPMPPQMGMAPQMTNRSPKMNKSHSSPSNNIPPPPPYDDNSERIEKLENDVSELKSLNQSLQNQLRKAQQEIGNLEKKIQQKINESKSVSSSIPSYSSSNTSTGHTSTGHSHNQFQNAFQSVGSQLQAQFSRNIPSSHPTSSSRNKQNVWKKLSDPNSNDFYYWNTQTNETVWDQPEDYFSD